MRKLNSGLYLTLFQRLERMADGIAQHRHDTQLPTTLNEAFHRQLQTNLSQLRQTYEQKQRDADLAYDEYALLLDQVKDQLAKDDSLLRGTYGKENPVIADFGTTVIINKGGRKKPPAPPPYPDGHRQAG